VTTEGAAFGAALLAGVGAGWFSTVDDAVAAIVRAEPAAEPGPEVTRYAELHARYRELYPALAPVFHRA
jgi:xylulokinase